MKYSQFKTLVGAAQALGSKAKTLEGARQFLKKYIKTHVATSPLEKRGNKPTTETRETYEGKRRTLRTEALLKKIQNRIDRSHSYYRCGSSWVERIENKIRVHLTDDPNAVNVTRKSFTVWSRNGKWSARDAYYDFVIHWSALKAPVTGGMVTLYRKEISPRVYEAAWAVQGKHLAMRIARGFIIKGYHVETDSLDEAMKKATKARKKALQATLMQRYTKKLPKNLDEVFGTAADSIAAGNCATGTDSFISAKLAEYVDAGKIAASKLLEIHDDVYTRRAVTAATVRHYAK